MFKNGKRAIDTFASVSRKSKRRDNVTQGSAVIDEFELSADITQGSINGTGDGSVCPPIASVRDGIVAVESDGTVNDRSAQIGNVSSIFQSPSAVVTSPASGPNRNRFMAHHARDQAPLVAAVVVPASPASPVAAAVVPAFPASPGNNRARFMSNCQPLKVSCDLSVVGMHNTGSRFTFQAVVLIVYPASVKPERRHLQLIDAHGSTGLTVWNDHVALFSQSSVGQVVRFTKLAVVHHNGQRSLSLGRDSTITFLADNVVPTDESKWWKSLLEQRPVRIIAVHDCEDNAIINVSGIVGTLYSETKKVRDEDKDLMCMRITDRTGFVDVRSWNHCEVEFGRYRERPIMFKRVRVTSFAGTKILELLDGSGTEVLSEFDGKTDLEQYWIE